MVDVVYTKYANESIIQEIENYVKVRNFSEGFSSPHYFTNGGSTNVYKVSTTSNILNKIKIFSEEENPYKVEVELQLNLLDNGFKNMPKLYGFTEDYTEIFVEYIDGSDIWTFTCNKGVHHNMLCETLNLIVGIKDLGITPHDLHSENIIIKNKTPYFIDMDLFEKSVTTIIPELTFISEIADALEGDIELSYYEFIDKYTDYLHEKIIGKYIYAED